MTFTSFRKWIAVLASAGAFTMATGADASTVNASITGFGARPGSFKSELNSMQWSWNQQTGEVLSLSLNIVGGAGRGERDDVGIDLDISGSSVVACYVSFLGQHFATWTIGISGAPEITTTVTSRLTEVVIVAALGNDTEFAALTPYEPAFGDPMLLSNSQTGVHITFTGQQNIPNGNEVINSSRFIREVSEGSTYVTSVTAVPVPGGLPLALAGLGAFVWIRRRGTKAA